MFENWDKERAQVAKIIRDQCVVKPDFPMHGKAPGTRYSSMFQLYNATDLHILLYTSVMILLDELDRLDIKTEDIQLAGRMWSALPLLGAMSMYMPDTNILLIRRERKSYGPNNVFEGYSNGKPVLIVDDLANSTISFAYCQSILIGHDIPVMDRCFAILNKKNKTDLGFRWDKYSNQEIISVVSRDMI
jgi:orotate phosphoribosyltransferase